MKIVKFNVGTGRSEGELVRENDKTVVVNLRRAGRTKQIKRHKEKHNVQYE